MLDWRFLDADLFACLLFLFHIIYDPAMRPSVKQITRNEVEFPCLLNVMNIMSNWRVQVKYAQSLLSAV